MVFDYTQYYLDLSLVNLSKREPEWVIEYNFSSYYGINDITPITLHSLADKMTPNAPNNNPLFTRYFRANSVRTFNGPQNVCDSYCAHGHFCAITRLDFLEFEQCLKAAASALASSAISYARPPFQLVLTIIGWIGFAVGLILENLT
ncbi:unnamed protein product [Brassicogethes aeneus]|uniref:Sphingomyelin phosphodiesterase C-terminal domain-containing protein n=1 Tax=Brassicogethes aeneus TaxID=1431903 RepID=A0A9P0B282_BRAAE|nr:unnamed protein product [Brassicogethes aeneus]